MDIIHLQECLAEKIPKKMYCHVILFILSTLWCFIDETMLYNTPAPNQFLYHVSVFADAILLSVSCSYIFLYITSVLPHKRKKKQMQTTVQYYKQFLSAQLTDLLKSLLGDADLNIHDIIHDIVTAKKKFDDFSNNRIIWSERECGLCKGKHDVIQVNPHTLEAISISLDNIDTAINAIIRISPYIEETAYLQNIITFHNSKFFKRIQICKDAARLQLSKSDKELKSWNNTYLDSLFKDELSILLFSKDDGRDTPQINVIEKLIECKSAKEQTRG